ncbi:MAG TPA: protein-glutamate O-methyltransferase [Candidatus Acidoferrum sp.]|nr:protein-glutamate O-methyltransferase [Candidatus Acidoferrum sp.]
MSQELALHEREFHLFRDLIHREIGIWLGDHKRELVRARLSRRLRACGCESFREYGERLTAGAFGPGEWEQMLNTITTNKTDFYREPAHFDFLAQEVLPRIKARAARGGSRRIRIWSAGCSSGEEPYTIAITVREALGNLLGWDVRILASDIDTEMLQRAAAGTYADDRVVDIPPAILHAYFRRGTGAYAGQVRVTSEIRNLVAFRRINLLEEPWPFRATFDCIFCRNVMIYFDRPTQHHLVSRLAAHVSEDGYLFLGHSESMHGLSDDFVVLRNTVNQKRRRSAAEGAGATA